MNQSDKSTEKPARIPAEIGIELALHQSFARRMAYYKSKHRTVGCKATHMVGIPLLVASVFVFPFSRLLFVRLQAIGWILQFIGHFVFEHNSPVLFEKPGPMTAIAAMAFVGEEWELLLQGESL